MISNFDTNNKTIRVSSLPATFSYLTRCLGSLYGDANGMVRNEEKGKGREEGESCKRIDTREEAKMRPKTRKRNKDGKEEGRKRKRERDRSKTRYVI